MYTYKDELPDLRFSGFKEEKDAKNYFKTYFLKNNSWVTKKVKDYYSSINPFHRKEFESWFIYCFDPKASMNKRFLNAIISVKKEEKEMTSVDSEPVEIEKEEYNLLIDCIASLKKQGLLKSISCIKLSKALSQMFISDYARHTIQDKLYRKKGYGEMVESITIRNEK